MGIMKTHRETERQQAFNRNFRTFQFAHFQNIKPAYEDMAHLKIIASASVLFHCIFSLSSFQFLLAPWRWSVCALPAQGQSMGTSMLALILAPCHHSIVCMMAAVEEVSWTHTLPKISGIGKRASLTMGNGCAHGGFLYMFELCTWVSSHVGWWVVCSVLLPALLSFRGLSVQGYCCAGNLEWHKDNSFPICKRIWSA